LAERETTTVPSLTHGPISELSAEQRTEIYRLRDEDLVFYDEPADRWLLNTFADVIAAARESSTLAAVAANVLLPMPNYPHAARHTTPRKPVSRAFTPSRIAGMEPAIRGPANLDEREFPDPERSDIRRQPNRQLVFGHGAHFCLGAPPGPSQTPITFETLLEPRPRPHPPRRYASARLGPAPWSG
jgi:cytochrome P450